MSKMQKTKSLSSTFHNTASETTWYGSKKSTMSGNMTAVQSPVANKKPTSPRFPIEACSTLNSCYEKQKLFDRISLKERQIEQAARENKVAQRMFYKIQFQNSELETKGKGRFNPVFDPKPEPGFKPSLRKLPIPHADSSEEASKKCRKPAPEGIRRPIRDPIIQGEHSQLVKAKDQEFTASVQSQVQNFKRFFLPSEWKEYTNSVAYSKQSEKPRPFASIKSILQYEYASPKAY